MMVDVLTRGKEAKSDEYSFDTVTDALLWAGWAQKMRSETHRAGSAESRYARPDSYRPFACDDVFMCINRAVQNGDMSRAEAKVLRWFINFGEPPNNDFHDHIHAKWESGLDAIKPYLQRKGIVYRGA